MKRKAGFHVILLTLTILMLFSQSAFAASRKVKSIKLSKTSITMTVGQSKTLKATVKPSGADKKVVWKSSNKKVVTVSSKGKLTAKKAGTAKITCSSKKYPKVKATCKVTVKKPVIKMESITLKDKNGLIPEGATAYLTVGYTYQLTAVIAPSNTTYKGVKWTSSDKSIMKVNKKGLCTSVSPGTVTITCTSTKYSKVSASLKMEALAKGASPVSAEETPKEETPKEETPKTADIDKDEELFDLTKTILSRTGEPLYRKLQGNDPSQKYDRFTYKPFWQVNKNTNGTINYILAYEKDSYEDIGTTYCLLNQPTVTIKYLGGGNLSSIRDSLRDGSYEFKIDPKYVLIGWSMWEPDTTKVELEKMLNEQISDSIYTQLKGYNASGAANRAGGSTIIVYGENADGELCGKYAGLISYNTVTDGTTYSLIGTDSGNPEIYGKTFSGTAWY